MNQARLYSKYNSLQKNDAAYVVDNYMRLIKWHRNASILDIGCGDGQVTLDLLLPLLPADFGKLCGVDVSAEMIEYAANINSKKHPKVRFYKYDITTTSSHSDGGDSGAADFHNEFDHIFSFYCLHWILDQRQAFKNIYNLLKPGGDILITFLASNPIYDVYEAMAKSTKWHASMDNVNEFISPYHHSRDPERELEQLLMAQGFTCHLCRVVNRSYIFPNLHVLRKSVIAVNPFVGKLDVNDVDGYIDDYIAEVKKLDCVTFGRCDNNNEETIKVPYKLFVVFASKSL